jgi:hypothetical protein
MSTEYKPESCAKRDAFVKAVVRVNCAIAEMRALLADITEHAIASNQQRDKRLVNFLADYDEQSQKLWSRGGGFLNSHMRNTIRERDTYDPIPLKPTNPPEMP